MEVALIAMVPQVTIQVRLSTMNRHNHNIILVPNAIQQDIWKTIAEILILVLSVVVMV